MKFDKLRWRMAEKRVSQVILAQNLGITVQAFSAKINGRSQFTLEEAVKIKDLLEIDNPNEFFFENYIPKMQQV